MTIYIIFKWRNWCYLKITMTRKSGKHLHVTYGTLNCCFDFIRSHHQCRPWSPLLEIEPTTTVCRSRNSTTGPPVHATYKRCRINKSWCTVRPLWPNVSWRYVIPIEDTATSGATSSQVIYIYIYYVSVCGQNYVTINIKLPFVIYIPFSIILFYFIFNY